MTLKQVFKWIRYIAGAVAVMTAVYGTHVPAAHAIGPEKPSIMTQGSGSTEQANSDITKIVNYILFFVFGGGTIALAISIGMCTPFIGQTSKGMAGIKGSVLVMLGAGFLYGVIAFIGSLV